MPSREYQVDAENVLPEGFWPGAPLSADPSELENLMLAAATVLEMVGGTFSIVAIRKEIAPGLWVPERYVAKWESYAPGRRQPATPAPVAEPAPAPEPEPQPDDLGPDPEAAAPEGEEWPPDAEQALAVAEA